MSFTIFNAHHEKCFEYEAGEEPHLNIPNRSILLFIGGGVEIPLYLRQQCGGKTFIPYPPPDGEIPAFALAVKESLFKRELKKHGWELEEGKGLTPENKV